MFGGGMTIENLGFFDSGSAVKKPLCSQNPYHLASTGFGS
jgi:hypothetical protein